MSKSFRRLLPRFDCVASFLSLRNQLISLSVSRTPPLFEPEPASSAPILPLRIQQRSLDITLLKINRVIMVAGSLLLNRFTDAWVGFRV